MEWEFPLHLGGFSVFAVLEWAFPLHSSLSNGVGIPTPFQLLKWNGNSYSIWEGFSVFPVLEWGFPLHLSLSNGVGIPTPFGMVFCFCCFGVGIPTPFQPLKWNGNSHSIWEGCLFLLLWSGNSHSIPVSQMEWEFPLHLGGFPVFVVLEWGFPLHFSFSNGVGIPTPFQPLKWSGNSHSILACQMEWEFPLHFSLSNGVGNPTPIEMLKWSGNSHSIKRC